MRSRNTYIKIAPMYYQSTPWRNSQGLFNTRKWPRCILFIHVLYIYSLAALLELWYKRVL